MNAQLPLIKDLQELHHLLKTQTVSQTEPPPKVNTLRQRIPAPVLSHFDRLRMRGKTPIAAVRHMVCSACHLQIPKNHVLEMHRNHKLNICDNCGTFIFLDESSQ